MTFLRVATKLNQYPIQKFLVIRRSQTFSTSLHSLDRNSGIVLVTLFPPTFNDHGGITYHQLCLSFQLVGRLTSLLDPGGVKPVVKSLWLRGLLGPHCRMENHFPDGQWAKEWPGNLDALQMSPHPDKSKTCISPDKAPHIRV